MINMIMNAKSIRTRKKHKKFFSVLLVAILLITMLPVSAEAKSAALSKTKLTLVKGTTYTLKVRNGKAKSYRSSKKTVATVTGKGKITAKKKGTSTIKVKVGKKTLKCKVTVINGKLIQNSLRISIGNSAVLEYSGTGTARKCVVTDNAIAAATSAGKNKFTIKGIKAGSAEAKVYVGDSVLKCRITVSEPVYAWVKRGVVKNLPDPKTEGVYSRSYDADAQSATVKEYFSGCDNSGNKVSSTLTTKCTSPLDTLHADDVIHLTVSMNMSNKTKDVGEVYRVYVSWNGCQSGTVDYNGGVKFTESTEMYLNCSQNQDFALNLDSDVSYTVPKGSTVGEQKAIVFSQFCAASVAWIYEWREL